MYNTGDVMYDAALFYGKRASSKDVNILADLNLGAEEYVLATCHRAENTDSPEGFPASFQALATIASDRPVVMPLHPRTKKHADVYGLNSYLECLKVIEPISFFDMVALEKRNLFNNNRLWRGAKGGFLLWCPMPYVEGRD